MGGYTWSEKDSAIMAEHYTKGKGAIKEVAEKHGVEPGWLKYIAGTRGLSRPKNVRWQPEAERMLEDMEGLCAYQIKRRLAREGYHYSLSSISWKMQARRISTLTDDYTVSDVARLLGLDSKKVAGWVKRGWLGTTKHANQLGTDHAHTHITQRQLAKFIIEHPTEIDLRRVPPSAQVWFIDLLAQKVAA